VNVTVGKFLGILDCGGSCPFFSLILNRYKGSEDQVTVIVVPLYLTAEPVGSGKKILHVVVLALAVLSRFRGATLHE
jgi:hypothetical protein